MRRWRHRRRAAGRWQLPASLLAGLLLAVGVISLFQSQLRPLVVELAGVEVSNRVTRLINETVHQDVADGLLDYECLVSFERDENGQITALKSDMAASELLRTHVTDHLLEGLEQLGQADFSIPIGTLSGSVLLAGFGPSIPVRVVSAGAVSAEFENRFSSAGINQTRHQILLNVEVEVSLVLPGGVEHRQVSTQVVVAETVLLGQVPDSYTYFSQFDNAKDASDSYFDYGANQSNMRYTTDE